MKDWVTVNELARIQGVTPRAIRKGVANNKYVVRQVNGTRGFKYEIFVPALNETTQNLIDFEKSKYEIEKNREPVLRKTSIIPTHAQQIALARYDLVNLWVDYKRISKNKTQAGKDFIDIYNDGKVYSHLFNILGKVSIGTIYRWHKVIKNNDDYKNLVPNYNYGEKEPNPKLTHEEELVFKSLLLTPNKTNIGKATKLTKYILKKKGLESPTCERNFRRYAEHLKRNHYDEWVLAREGQKALRDKVQPYITRDISKLEVGDVLVADGHRLSIQCLNPFTGRPCRPTLIGYLDWKSTALVGYEIMLEENTQAMTTKWLLEEIIKELGDSPFYRTAEIFEQIVRELIKKPRLIIVDEIDYLAHEKSTIEMLRDIHDRTHTPIVLIGMAYADKKLKRYKHLYDRLSEILQFQKFPFDDTKNLIDSLSEIKFDNSAIEHIQISDNRFRQIVKIIDKAESYGKANDLSVITSKDMQILLK